jgi:hypothetical protein|nr:MAG TPA: hypothetical protein [Caudoviricetes sp.]
MNVNHKLPCQILSFSQAYEDDDDLMKVRIKVCHTGENPNGSDFSLASLTKAQPTLSNRPILAYSVFDEESFEVVDFGGHDMEHKIIENENGEYELKTRYLETPLGVINENHEYSLEIDEETGETYPVITGFIWKSYSNGAWKLIEQGKGVSMEISVKSGVYNKQRKIFEIEDFSYRGITVLSDSVEPAMKGANIEKYTVTDINNSVEMFNNKLKEKEVGNVSEVIESVVDTEVVENEVDNVVETEPTDEVVEITEESKENKKVEETEVVEEFALSVDNIRNSINSQLKDRMVEVEDWWGDTYQTREFYLFDILPHEKVAVVEDNCNYYNYYGIPYEIQGDTAVLKYDEKVAYIQEWRPKNEGETLAVFEKKDELKDIVLEKFENKEAELKTIKENLSKLQEFKSKIDLEELKVQVDEISGKYDLDVDTTELKEKAITKDITLEQFEKELKVLFAEKVLENGKFSKDVKEEPAKVTVTSHEEGKTIYGGLFEKHGLK